MHERGEGVGVCGGRGGDADKQSDRQMETDRLTARRAVRGRDVEMKTIFGTFFFFFQIAHKHTHSGGGEGGGGGRSRLTGSDRHAYRLKKG